MLPKGCCNTIWQNHRTCSHSVPWMQLFHYRKMTWEFKLVLCIQPVSIRGIVAAAQFQIIQCMLTNGIGISGLTVGWIVRKKNILIHEELPGKLKNARFSHSTFSLLALVLMEVFHMDALGWIPQCRTIPDSVLFCKMLDSISTHMTRKYSLKYFLHENKRNAVLVQNRNLYPSGCYWTGEEIPQCASTTYPAILVQIFCTVCKSTSSVGFKPNSWLILELWHDINYSLCAIHNLYFRQGSIGLCHISVLRSSNLINLSSHGNCSMCFLPQLRSLQKCLCTAVNVYFGFVSMCKTHTSMDLMTVNLKKKSSWIYVSLISGERRTLIKKKGGEILRCY